MSDQKPGVLRNLRVKRVALVDMGANFDKKTGDGAHIMLFKSAGPGLGSVHVDKPMGKEGDGTDPDGCPCPNCDGADMEEYEKATLDAESRSKIPDSKFLAVWTDAQGKKHRKLPVHDAGHLTAAAGRIDQTQMPADVKAAAHRKLESMTSHKEEKPVAKTIKDVMALVSKAMVETDVTKRAALLKDVDDAVSGMTTPPGHEGTDQLGPAHVDAMKAAYHSMHKAVQAFGPGPHPPTHPVHGMMDQLHKMGACLKAAGHNVDEPGALGDLPLAKAHRDRIEAAEAKATVLEKQMATLVRQGEEREMRDVLKSFKATPFNLDGENATNDIGKFVTLKRSNPDEFDRIIALFKAADSQMAMSKAFANTGSSLTGVAGGAWETIVAKAKNLREKSADTTLTLEKAIDRIMDENPDLVAKYRQEMQ